MMYKNIITLSWLFFLYSSTVCMFSSLIKNLPGSYLKNYRPAQDRLKTNNLFHNVGETPFFPGNKKKMLPLEPARLMDFAMRLPRYVPQVDLNELKAELVIKEALSLLGEGENFFACSCLLETALLNGIRLAAYEDIVCLINFSFEHQLVLSFDCIKQLRAALKAHKREKLIAAEDYIQEREGRIKYNDETLHHIQELESSIDQQALLAAEYVHVQPLSFVESASGGSLTDSTIDDGFVFLEDYFK